MSTDTDKPLNGAPEPFRRPVVWGRPPATVFRAGPLPRGERLPPLPEPPRRPSGPGILSGSVIPHAAPSAAEAPKTVAPVPAPEPRNAPAATGAAEPALVDHAADLTVRPLPPLEPEPRPQPIGPAAALQLDSLPPFQAAPPPNGVQRPTSPAPSARHVPSGADSRPANRLPLYAGIAAAAVAVLTLGGWIWTRSPAEAPTPVAAPLAPAAEIPVVETPSPPIVAETAPETPAPPTPAPASRPVEPPPATVRAPPPTVVRPTPPAPEAVAPPPAVVTAPLIEIVPAPPPGPAPTEAERPQTDPEAPIATRPQPIG